MIGLMPVTCEIFSRARASGPVSDWVVPPAPNAPFLLASPGKMMMRLVPRPVIRSLIAALAPWVNVKAVITAATPINIPSAVSSERMRLAHRASNALPKLAPSIIPRLNPRPRSSGIVYVDGSAFPLCVPTGCFAGGVGGITGCIGLLIGFPP